MSFSVFKNETMQRLIGVALQLKDIIIVESGDSIPCSFEKEVRGLG